MRITYVRMLGEEQKTSEYKVPPDQLLTFIKSNPNNMRNAMIFENWFKHSPTIELQFLELDYGWFVESKDGYYFSFKQALDKDLFDDIINWIKKKSSPPC